MQARVDMFEHAARHCRTPVFDGAHETHLQTALESTFSYFSCFCGHYSAFFHSQARTASLNKATIMVSVMPNCYVLWSSNHGSIEQCEKALKTIRATEKIASKDSVMRQ